MGFLVFLAIVAVIIAIIVVVKKNKKKKAIEEFKNCDGYALALKIREELEKKGFKRDGEPDIGFSVYGRPYAYFTIAGLCIYCAAHVLTTEREKERRLATGWEKGFLATYFLEAENIGVFVYEGNPTYTKNKESQEVLNYIKLASDVMTAGGFGVKLYVKGKLVE
jgi:preprotein translocase subunit YajC